MRLGIAIKKTPPKERKDGTIPISSKLISVIDMDTGNEVNNMTGFIWGDKSLLLSPLSYEGGGF